MSKRKSFLVFLLLLLYTAVVWSIGWFFLRDSTSTLIAVGSVLTVCGFTLAGVYWLVSRLSARPETAAAPAQPVLTAAVAGDPDLQIVQTLLKEADGKLARSPRLASERVRPALADLPLYILVGAEGSAKTTTFLQAGLEPEPLAGQVYSGPRIIPTPVANFWYAKSTLIVEAAGRMFLDDAARWSGFLDCLRGRSAPFLKTFWSGGAKKQNLRGLILFVDSSYFIGIPDESHLTALARRLQERLRMAAQAFASDLPVWVVFSKADNIPYFREYFTRLREPEEQQPLGCPLEPLTPGERSSVELFAESETRRLSQAFNTLYYSLAQYRLKFLDREADAGRKPAIYEFPRELKRMRSSVVQFLVEVFRPNPLQPEPQLRGFYFMGTRPVPRRSDDTTMDRSGMHLAADATRMLRGDAITGFQPQRKPVASGAGSEPEPMVDRWSFVSQIFHEIVQTSPVPVRQYRNRSTDVYRKVAWGALIGVSALLGVGFGISTWNNYTFLKSVESASETVQAIPLGQRELTGQYLDKLDRLREHLDLLNEYDSALKRPWSMAFLLYPSQGLIQPARKLYFTYFREYLLNPVAQGLAAQLGGLPAKQDDARPYGQIYDQLKTYLTITTSITTLGCPVEPPLGRSLQGFWGTGRAVNEEFSQKALRQFEFYAQELRGKHVPFTMEPQKEAITRGQGYLNDFGGEERVYRTLVDKANQSVRQPVRLADYAGRYPQVLAGVGDIPGAFTRDGSPVMSDLISKENGASLGESCVLGLKLGRKAELMEGSALSNRLKDLYARDYAQKWKDLLSAVKVKPYGNRPDAVAKLAILEDTDSPLLGLLYMAHENAGASVAAATRTVLDPRIVNAAKNVGGQIVNRSTTLSRIKGVTDSAGPGMPAIPAGGGEAAAEVPLDAFQPVHALFTAQSSKRNWNDQANSTYTHALGALRKAMEGLAQSSSPKTDPLNLEVKKAVDEGFDTVKEIARKFDRGQGMDEQVKRLLNEPFEGAKGLFIGDLGSVKREEMNGALAGVCAKLRQLQTKYPFNSGALVEASPEEVAAVFSPQTGALWAFHRQYLSQILAKQGRSYALRVDAPPDTKLDTAFVDGFNQMARITEALFADGSAQPSMRYRFNVLPNPDVKAITLTIDGQGGSGPRSWPGSGPQGLKLDVQSSDATVTMASYSGIWSVFQMMAEADPHSPGAREITISKVKHGRGRPEPVDVGGKEVTVRIRIEEFPGGVETAFDRGFFGCRCPGRVAN